MPGTLSVPLRRPLLVAAAGDLRLQADRAAQRLPHVQSPDSLGPIHFVGREAQQIDAQRLDVDRHLAHRLRGVAVQRTPRWRQIRPISASG